MPTFKIISIACMCLFCLNLGYAQTEPKLDTMPDPVAQRVQKLISNKQLETVDVLGIDLNADEKVTAESVRNMGDGLLLLYMPSVLSIQKLPAKNPELDKLGFVHDFDILALLDEDNSGRVDALDASYHHMYVLVFFNRGQRYKIVPLSDIGVRALFLKQSHMQNAPQNQGLGFTDHAERAMMADSNHRKLKVIKVKKKLFEQMQK